MHNIHPGLLSPWRTMGLSIIRFSWTVGLAFVISMCTSPEAWALTVSPTGMTFQAVQGATNPPSQTVIVSKSNTRQTSWTATDSATWLTVSPGAGDITNSARVVVAVNTSGLAAGTYTASVTIKVVKGGSASVPVTLTVAPATTSASATSASTTTSTSTTSTSTTTTLTSTSTTATLSWSPPSDTTNLAGYKVYIGTTSGAYGTPINVGNMTTYALSNLALGNTYFFVVTGYDASGNESLPSNEVSKSIY